MTNPLVAAPVSTTTATSGVPLLEDAQSVRAGIESGDWASAVMGAAGTAMDALSMVADPFGSILAAGVGWLMEHVGPLKEALDKLAGDPDQITAHSQTWQNIAQELGTIGQDLTSQVDADVQSWAGPAADSYRRQAADLTALLGAASEASAGTASGAQTAGQVVAAVRQLVRDTIAKVVAHMISWALQVIATLGIGLTWVVPQVVSLVAKTATQIAGLVKRLTTAIKTLSELLGKAGKVFGGASDALKKIKSAKPATPGKPTSLPQANNFVNLGGKTSPSSAGGGGSRSIDDNTPSPGKPYQPPYGPTNVSQSANDHVIFGNLKPPRPNRPGRPPNPWGFSGGHVLHNDLPPGTVPHNTAPAGARPSWHGAGVTGGNPPVVHGPVGPTGVGPAPGPGPFGSFPHPNGVYDLPRPTMTDPHGGNAGKPMSTMFPQGLNPGAVQNIGDQAWNGGRPNGPVAPVAGARPDAHGNPQSYTWHGQGQIPYTPIYNPGGADHGSGAGNHPNAGSTVNVAGYANPYYPPGAPTANPPLQPATFYPDGNDMSPPRPTPYTPVWNPGGADHGGAPS
ncbi:WXG100 family type VII secretion target [Amycolatopsis acidiphila]|uniref:WXG100 family type VII secretion target n=1 Tax=Amycolatopsis acidiphila TaxID=715473 RepID=A0A558AM07_9PSEU|nr:WXG100 family type VII secretion target [Amycolatopsis acidiphila]TVT25293.1 WXG100 family type VII secretion target [Amycolatopsis acidiphila]UIJ62416.1 WXG100 family type VII secretion target [Amycolatopsis acidiphila]GHG83568.1 hypothetical protein GCM10017788_54780 [Amycolatopsis acidiphila]